MLEAEHVLPVVLQRRLQRRAPATPEVVEVGLGDQVAGDVVLPLEAEQPLLDRPQGAPFETGPEEAAGEVEEVDMVSLGELTGEPRHQPAGPEQWQVEAEPVVGRQPPRLAELGVERDEEGGLVARLGEEELDKLNPVGVGTADRRREDLGPGAAGEAGGLGVEEAELVDLQAAQLRPGLGPVEAADRQHLRPAPGDAVVVVDRLEAARR